MSVRRFAVLLVKYALLVVALLVTTGLSALFTMRIVLTAQEVDVPSLVGKRLPEAGALASDHGLLLKIEGRRHDAKVPPDRVMGQEPSPGSTLKRQRSIRVWVSLGPQRLVVPPVEGESVRGARLTLDQAKVPVGRVVEVHDTAEEGTILQQHPPPGETSALGPEGASLLVSAGPTSADYVMPDLINRPASPVLDTLARAGLKVADVRYRPYPGLQPGMVLRQSPAAGYRVNSRTTVTIEVSRSQ